MIAYLIDPHAKTVEQVEYSGNYQEIYKLMAMGSLSMMMASCQTTPCSLSTGIISSHWLVKVLCLGATMRAIASALHARSNSYARRLVSAFPFASTTLSFG